ncbi:LacI family DNA-binding transcriptional regulator [Janibacter sp. GS2]|uniref:LacI family DNA-binding transcriptional regulator n=1 Tax=Janibacter sp. GS2 TaxID=3442646 RepID=UPI003EBDAE5C
MDGTTAYPTIRDIAARVGMSKSLVSLALQDSPRVAQASKAAILSAAEELGYRRNAAARALVAHRTRTIGVFLLDLHNPITADLVAAVQEEARRRGYQTIVVVGGDSATERAEIVKLLEFRVEGIVAVGHRLPAGGREAITSTCPGVIIGSEQTGVPDLLSISNDDAVGARLAVEHLISLGHTRIAHVTGGRSLVARRRRRGYEQAMRDSGLGAEVSCHDGDFTDEGGHHGAWAALTSGRPPTALFVVNDFAAFGAMAAVVDLGLRVPEDVSVVGYDGTRLSGLRALSLTTVVQPLESMGSQAVAHLCSRLDGDDASPKKRIRLTPSLVARETTAPLRTAEHEGA